MSRRKVCVCRRERADGPKGESCRLILREDRTTVQGEDEVQRVGVAEERSRRAKSGEEPRTRKVWTCSQCPIGMLRDAHSTRGSQQGGFLRTTERVRAHTSCRAPKRAIVVTDTRSSARRLRHHHCYDPRFALCISLTTDS